MKKLLLAVIVAIHVAAQAVPFTIPLPSSGSLITEHISPLGNMAGEPLEGQSFTLDFLCPSGTFIRLYPASQSFIGLLVFTTDADTFPGFVSGLGYTLDALGLPAFSTTLGAAASSSGMLAAGLSLPLPASSVLDLFGLHYELSLPTTPGVHVTGAELRLVAAGPFGVGPGVPEFTIPEGGSAVFMLLIGLFFCALVYAITKK